MSTDLVRTEQVSSPDASLALARRVERAQADQNRAYVETLAREHPEVGASALAIKGGWSLFAGVGSPLTQGMAMGLDGPLCASDLRRIEAHLGQHGGDLQIELCPFADATVSVLLASRGYRVQEFNQVWVRSLDADLPLPREHDAAAARACGFELRPVREGEAQAYARVLLAGFLGQEEQASPELALVFEPMPFVEGTECWLAWVEGEPAGGGSVAVFDGVATLFGTSVLPRFRRRGIQEALIRARLARARALGCDLATSNTQPCTPSQRNMERAGFRVAYPKVVMLRRGVAPCPS